MPYTYQWDANTGNQTTATATDNCGVDVETYSPDSGSPLPVGTTAVRFTAIDGSDNEGQCTFNVEIVDSEVRWFRVLNETDCLFLRISFCFFSTLQI